MTRNETYKITKLLLFVVSAPTFQERLTLLRWVVNKTGITFRAAYQRLGRMGLTLEQGPTVIDAYEAKMKAKIDVLVRTHQEQTKLLTKLGIQAIDMRAWVHRTVSVTEAASILRVRKAQVMAWTQDLEVLRTDLQGRIQHGEIRRFTTEEGSWALPKTKTRAKPRSQPSLCFKKQGKN